MAGSSVLIVAAALLANAAPPLQLERGTKIELAFGPGVQRAAIIRLRQGESADVAVLQRGVDVVVTLRAPDGALLDEVDSPNGRNGDEPVNIYARSSGEYQLFIRPISETEPQGRIEVRVAALRSVAETSRIRRQRDQMRNAAADWLRRDSAALPPVAQLVSTETLPPFDRLATSARVVGLGEATHGSRELSDVRLGLVKRLVARNGFRVVAIEDSVSRWRALEPYVGGATVTPAVALEWGWIGRRSRRELLEWARSWNLRNPTDRIRIVGVDPQDNGLARGAMGPMLERAYGESARETWGRTAGELAKADEQTQVFGDSGIGPSTSALLQTLAARLEADAPLLKSRLGRPDYDKLLSYARELAAFADFNSGGAWPSRSRDWYMALGILRALEEGGSNAKAVFWGHNSHVSATARSWGPTGAVLRSALGCGYRAVATTFGEGSFLAQIPNDPADRLQVTTVLAVAEDSIEAALAKIRPGAHITSWECGANSDRGPDWLKEPHMMRWVGGLYAPGTALSGSYRQYALTDAFDAVVYFPVVQAEADPGDRPIIPPRKR